MDTAEKEISRNMIPERTKRLFWDADKNIVDPVLHRSYVIQRIMDYGDIEDVRWMKAAYSSQEMIEVVKKRRGLSRKSAYFWSTYFNIPKEEIECLKMPYPKSLRPF